MERFWQKVNINGPVPISRPELGPCWLWTAGCYPDGYGQFKMAGKGRRAHAVAYEICVGRVPAGLVIDHLCRVHGCVNPAHLEPVTSAENSKRGLLATASAARQLAKTHCPKGHEYSAENTYQKPSGGRQCRECGRVATRRWSANRRAA